ncbi:uncharacterized protein Gyg isoform X1 [Anoplolepis gracilipes]|uniref:uncharacterized protein Gyg isoform X1 n=1 Tax=Anoplolepis gracilipes TaxID=354296 RepID=UPI003B9E6BA4
MGGYAWVTLATNDAYSLGALVLAHSLRRVDTKYELACLVTPGVTATMREKLATVFSLVQEVNVLDSKDEANLALLARPELGITFTKLHCWRLTQYEKCVFIDADALVVRNCDELFEREELSAAPDVGWPDCFNSGVFVFRPSQQTFASITAFAAAKGSFDGGDQGLLNMYFSDWATKDISKHLPFIYNMCSTATYSYLPAFKQFGEDVRIIHFIGITKPWLQYFDTLTGVVQPPPGSVHLQPLLQLWWNIFCERVHPQLSPSMATSTLAPIWHAFASSSYLPSVSDISVYSDAIKHNDDYSRTPDFSEFKDPWEEYSSQNDSFSTDNNASNDKNDYYYGTGYEKETTDVDRQNDYNPSQFERNQQFHYEQQSSSASLQTQYNLHPTNNEHYQHREHVTSHSEENYNQRSTIQHTEHHWQQYSDQKNQYQPSEQRHHPEQHKEQKQYDEQYQQHHYEQRHHNEPSHYGEQRQHNEHHQHSGQSLQHDYYKMDNYPIQHQSVHEQSHPTETWHENHAQYTSDRTAYADYQHHTVSHNDSHPQHRIQNNAQDNFTCHQSNEKNSEQSSETTNKQTDTQRIDFHPSSPAPCTDLQNVAMRSDPNITEHLDNANMGIAGALAQLTLGEARSAEQIALEQHMRKQSWEQGQIDYMGRDSFDNIWKKICETISLSPQRQPSPVKEDTAKPKESVATAESAELKTVAPIDVELKPVVEADKDPTQSPVCEASEEKLSAAQTTSELSEDITIVQSSKQEASALPSEESVTVQAASIKVSSELIQPTAIESAKSTDKELCETSTELSSTEESASQGASESLLIETQQADSQPSTCSLVDATCKKEVITSFTPIESATTPTEKTTKLEESPASATQDATELTTTLISADSPENIVVSSIISEVSLKETAKRVDESDVMQPLTIDPSERHAEVLLAASEISTVSPVPIQVAESVLQAEPKESVSDAAVDMSDQAISTTVTAVHEPTDIVSAAITVEPVQLNGSICEKGNDIATVVAELSENADTSARKADDLILTKDGSSETPSEQAPSEATVEKVESVSGVVSSETSSAKVENIAKLVEQTETIIEAPEVKSPTQIVKMETTETKPVEEIVQAEQAETTEPAEQAKQTEVTEATVITKSVSEISDTSEIAEPSSTKEPTEAKTLNIPSTPTIIEATPPTSPSVESTQEAEQKQAGKKSLKTSDSLDGADGEGADKKATKKTVKKVTKKPKTKHEETASSTTAEGATTAEGLQNKAKKTVKVTKKIGAKTGQTLETDTSVPETPPPPPPSSSSSSSSSSSANVTSDAPVPPKRKTKSTSAKETTGKKPEVEE